MNVLDVKSTIPTTPPSEAPEGAAARVTFRQADRDYVYRVACRIVGPEAADDVAQEAMILAFRFRDTFRGESRYTTWLYRIAATTALEHLRRKHRSREQLAAETTFAHRVVDPARSPEALYADLEQAEAATAVLGTLAPKYRDVVVLRTELSEAATAERLGISVANVKVRAHRARQWLRAAIAPAND